MLPWLLCIGLLLALLILCIYIIILHRDMEGLHIQLREILSQDTNRLLSVSSSDGHIRKLAAELNQQLKTMRKLQLRYQKGDAELKNAITNIAHDLRTPLAAISGYLELLGQEKSNEKVIRYLSIIRERTDSLKSLTEDLFRYSVISSEAENMQLEPVSLNRELEIALAASYGILVERNIEPRISMPDAPVVRNLDKTALQRVFSNILINAAKYSDGDLSVSLLPDGTVTFSNTARSLSEIEVGKLFDRFYTVENAKGSTGLGLSIAKILTEKMGGSIEAELIEDKLHIQVVFIQ